MSSTCIFSFSYPHLPIRFRSCPPLPLLCVPEGKGSVTADPPTCLAPAYVVNVSTRSGGRIEFEAEGRDGVKGSAYPSGVDGRQGVRM